MKKTLHSAIFYTILFLGLISPMLVFSQQEVPKRVSVVVTAKEIGTEKQLVQVPADNLPKTISKPTIKKHTKPFKEAITDSYVATAKAPAIKKTEEKPAKPTAKPSKEKPVIAKVSAIESKPTTAAPTDNSANQQFNASANTADTNKANTADSISPSDDISISKTVQQIGEKTITTIKARKDNKELATFTHSSKVNSISYIWIGCFLIIAGIVLGLLFGRPAFLISFVGVVFITLGLVI